MKKSRISTRAIEKEIKNTEFAGRVVVFDEIDSTNTEARRRFVDGQTSPLFLVANYQTAGRGRLGRSFLSPAGKGLYLSILYPLKGEVSDIVSLTGAVAVAVRNAVETLCGADLKIKWVNDLLKEGKKVCGILCESVCREDAKALIIGIGINLRPMDFPEELAAIAGSLSDEKVSAEKLAAKILCLVLPFLRNPADRSWLADYRNHSCVIGKEVTCLRGGESFPATAVDIDEDGGLILRLPDGSETVLQSGEVSIRLRPVV